MAEEEKWEPPERPWFAIAERHAPQEDKIREFAREQGFETLRGFWKWMESRAWDYYDVIGIAYEE